LADTPRLRLDVDEGRLRFGDMFIPRRFEHPNDTLDPRREPSPPAVGPTHLFTHAGNLTAEGCQQSVGAFLPQFVHQTMLATPGNVGDVQRRTTVVRTRKVSCDLGRPQWWPAGQKVYGAELGDERSPRSSRCARRAS